jgi:8-oxo-dGTP pyrophosphatase MutT (NUDIX family)
MRADAIRHRQAVRALLLTGDHEILLMQIRAPQGGDPFWIAPGGGLEPGEAMEAGLRRELAEELGLNTFEIGPVLCRRQHTFDWGEQRICQREEYRAVHVARFEPRMTDAVEARVLQQFRWWRIADLARSTERFTPLALADIVQRYLTEGAPSAAPDVEVLVD